MRKPLLRLCRDGVLLAFAGCLLTSCEKRRPILFQERAAPQPMVKPSSVRGRVTMAPTNRRTCRPYKIQNQWYFPQFHYEYREIGVASFYGVNDGFHKKPTATGETYHRDGMTAAHRTLPLPCMVRVTNLENGRSIVVKVNDRGPFVGERIIDLSHRASVLLGFATQGKALVLVETLVGESLALVENRAHAQTLKGPRRGAR